MTRRLDELLRAYTQGPLNRDLQSVIRWDTVKPTEILWSDRLTGTLWVGTLVELRDADAQRWLEIAVTDLDWQACLHGEIDLRTLFARATAAEVVDRDAELRYLAGWTVPAKIPRTWLPPEPDRKGDTPA